MAALFARYQETGFDCGGELPDHVANLLRYLGRCEADEQRELAEFCLLGPLEKMIGALNDHNPYRLLLLSVSDWLMQEFPDALAVPMPGRSPGAAAIGCGGCSCDTTTTPQSPSTPPILHDQEILTGSHYD